MPPAQVHLVVAAGEHRLDGVVRPGESWLGAATRTCAALPGTPWPVDLAGAPLVFTVDAEPAVSLRAMTRADLPGLARWQAEPHVARWWVGEAAPTLESVTERYGPRIDGTSPTRMWAAEVHGRSVGMVQDYRVGDHPEYSTLLGHPDAVGCDYLVGEPQWVGRGIGTRMVWAWMLRARDRFADVTTLLAAPDHRNEASLQMLDRLGFQRGLWFDEPQRSGEVTTMVACTLDVATVLGKRSSRRT